MQQLANKNRLHIGYKNNSCVTVQGNLRNTGSTPAFDYFLLGPIFVVESIHVTVAGGNARFYCTGKRNSSLGLLWSFKSIADQSEYEVIHNGQRDDLPRYEEHVVVNNATSITLMNATAKFAGSYRCQEYPDSYPLNEFELVVLGKCSIFKLQYSHESFYKKQLYLKQWRIKAVLCMNIIIKMRNSS